MPLTPKLLYIGNGNNSNVYTAVATANSYTIVKNINICNTTASNVVASVHIVPTGQSAANNNKIISNTTIVGNDVTYYNTSIIMPANSSIYVNQGGTSLTVAISGVEFTP